MGSNGCHAALAASAMAAALRKAAERVALDSIIVEIYGDYRFGNFENRS